MMMETYTGLNVNPLDMSIMDIRIEDIAHALSLQCRYNGHCKEFYSVAQHSMLVSHFIAIGPRTRLFGLLHDAAEAYLGDMIAPLKKRIPEYKPHERELQNRIYFALCGGSQPTGIEQVSIKLADRRMLITETKFLMPSQGKDWGILMKPYPFVKFDCQTAERAENLFLRSFEYYKRELKL